MSSYTQVVICYFSLVFLRADLGAVVVVVGVVGCFGSVAGSVRFFFAGDLPDALGDDFGDDELELLAGGGLCGRRFLVNEVCDGAEGTTNGEEFRKSNSC